MFRALELSDKGIFDLYKKFNISHSQYNFTNLYMWKHEYHPLIDIVDGLLCIVIEVNAEKFALFPVGDGDLKLAFNYISNTFGNIAYTALDDKMIEKLTCFFDHAPEIKKAEYLYDYVYFAEKLKTLSGRNLHSKRNHLKHFLKNYSFSFELISDSNIPDCEYIEKQWNKSKNGAFIKTDTSYISTMEVLNNYSKLGCVGGVIYVDGVPAAFSVGELMRDDMFVVHIEKAIGNYSGIYTAINQFCAENVYSDSIYINREEDMGIQTLRKAKLSYHPCMMLEYKIARF